MKDKKIKINIDLTIRIYFTIFEENYQIAGYLQTHAFFYFEWDTLFPTSGAGNSF